MNYIDNMEKELLNSDKELLLKDLCARLPYEVKVSVNSEYLSEGLIKAGYDKTLVAYGITADGSVSFTLDKGLIEYSMPILSIKPYLFPLSSMTEEQKRKYNSIIYRSVELHHEEYYDVIDVDAFEELQDFYHENHIDYREFIEKGLAIDATGLNIY